MYQIIKSIIGFSTNSQYLSTDEQYYLSLCVAVIAIFTIVTLDWLRQIYKSLVNRLH